jgi:hypothetical protein
LSSAKSVALSRGLRSSAESHAWVIVTRMVRCNSVAGVEGEPRVRKTCEGEFSAFTLSYHDTGKSPGVICICLQIANKTGLCLVTTDLGVRGSSPLGRANRISGLSNHFVPDSRLWSPHGHPPLGHGAIGRAATMT